MEIQVDLKQMTGIMNLDDNQDVMPPFHHKYLMNGRFRGVQGGGLRVESIPGNVLIPNYLLPAGTNECIGAFYDPVNRRILWANYNSNGRNGWYKYSLETKQVSKIFLCFTDSATDILNFSLDYPIHSANIIYRPEQDGDLLYWCQGNKRPSYLNIDTVSTLAPFISDMINAGKNAPIQSLTVAYGDNSSIRVNNLVKRLFQFTYRLVYANLEKSTVAPISETPLPINGFDPIVMNDPTKNNTIIISGVARLSDNVTVGDIVGVEILGRECQGGTYGDWFLITSIPSSEFSSGTFSYAFINDSIYVTEETVYVDNNPDLGLLYQSYLPDGANTMEAIRDSIVYGAITEGYPNLTQQQCEVYLYSGLGEGANALVLNIINTADNQLSGIIGGSPASTTTISTQFEYDNGIQYAIQASITPAPATSLELITANFVAALNAEFVIEGISGEVTATQVGTGNTFIVTTTNPAGVFDDMQLLNDSGFTVPYPNSVLRWGSQYRWGIIYFDERGKTNGVISFVNTTPLNNFGYVSPDFFTMPPPPGNQLVPYMMATINHLPPTWAKRFQWVRTPNQTTGKFIQPITNDYQEDTDFIYFGIQNITYLKTKNTGFIPNYDFATGDRVKVMASYNPANGVRTSYGTDQFDYEILGVVERTMNAPNTTTNGRFLKVKKPTTAYPAYTKNSFIDIYTPLLRVNDTEQFFYEFGETFEINANDPYTPNVLYHGGNLQEQLADTPAAFLFYDGDFYFKPREYYLSVGDTTVVSSTVMDISYSDYFPSNVNSNGRGFTINPDANTIYYPTMLRWSKPYQQDTNINQLNIFNPTDFDTVERRFGDIMRFLVEDDILYVYQKTAVGGIGIFARYIQSNEGVPELVTTNEIISPNNINYLKGAYGLGDQPCSVFRSDGVHYFCDPVRGDIVRRSGDGLTPVGQLYYGQYYLRNLVSAYNRTYIRTNGSKAKIMGYYDFFEGQAHFILQAGTLGASEILPYNFSFNEKRNGFCGFYKDNPEMALQAAEVTYGWKNGQMYIYNDNGSDRKLFGVPFDTSITLVFNDKEQVRKKYMALGYQSSDKWVCQKLSSFSAGENIDAIITSFINPQTGFRQSSQLKLVDIDADGTEGQITAALLRDINSGANPNIALLEGDYLLGWWLEAEFTYKGNGFSYFYAPYLTWIESNRNF